MEKTLVKITSENTELLKAGIKLATKTFLPLCQAIWEGKRMPDDWLKAVIVQIPKEGLSKAPFPFQI